MFYLLKGYYSGCDLFRAGRGFFERMQDLLQRLHDEVYAPALPLALGLSCPRAPSYLNSRLLGYVTVGEPRTHH